MFTSFEAAQPKTQLFSLFQTPDSPWQIFYFINMKARPENPRSFRDFQLTSFDCFGTLIDWNGKRLGHAHPKRAEQLRHH